MDSGRDKGFNHSGSVVKQKLQAVLSHCGMAARAAHIRMKKLTVEQQLNAVDCGFHAVLNMISLAKHLEGGRPLGAWKHPVGKAVLACSVRKISKQKYWMSTKSKHCRQRLYKMFSKLPEAGSKEQTALAAEQAAAGGGNAKERRTKARADKRAANLLLEGRFEADQQNNLVSSEEDGNSSDEFVGTELAMQQSLVDNDAQWGIDLAKYESMKRTKADLEQNEAQCCTQYQEEAVNDVEDQQHSSDNFSLDGKLTWRFVLLCADVAVLCVLLQAVIA
jgi:hypothetical protein